MHNDMVSKLIDLKKNEMETLARDLLQLQSIQTTSIKALSEKEQLKQSFLLQLRESEISRHGLHAGNMIKYRDFLNHLHLEVKTAESSLMQVNAQVELAQGVLKKVYIEMKSYETLAKRRSNLFKVQENRKAYLIADDQELLRINRRKQLHAKSLPD